MAQRSSYNKWDRIIFRNNPPFGQRIFSLTEFNMGYGARYLDQDYEIRRTGFSTLIGYRYSRAISVGLGAGVEAYNGGTMVPLYAEGQIYMNTPLVSAAPMSPSGLAARRKRILTRRALRPGGQGFFGKITRLGRATTPCGRITHPGQAMSPGLN